MTLDEKNEFLVREWLDSWTDSGVDGPVFSAAPQRLLEVWNALSKASNGAAESPADTTIEVLFLCGQSLEPQTQALLARMVTAMGLALERVAIGAPDGSWTSIDSAPIAVSRARAIVAFGAEPPAEVSVPVVKTHSLESILAQPSLKRAVWEDLQNVMQMLKA